MGKYDGRTVTTEVDVEIDEFSDKVIVREAVKILEKCSYKNKELEQEIRTIQLWRDKVKGTTLLDSLKEEWWEKNKNSLTLDELWRLR